MQISQIAAQLYTVRESCQTTTGLAAAARKIKAIGYSAVQISGVGPIPALEIMKIMRDTGLSICATHEPGTIILQEPSQVVDRLQELGCKHTAYPFPQDVNFSDFNQVISLAKSLDAAGAVLRASGCTLGYHNHAHEFAQHSGVTILEKLFQLTEPQNLVAELDTYWIQYGGGDVISWIDRMSQRLPTIHLKDYGIGPSAQPVFREVGYGNLNFPAIIAAARRAGCAWYIVEQDSCPGDPFESLKLSYDYLKQYALAP